MKRIDFKAGLFFGIVMTVFFIIQNLWTSDTITSKIVGKSLIVGLISGIFSGFFFGLIIGIFKSSKFVDTTTKIETQLGEDIIFQTPANHFKGAEAVGGKLYLTNKRLVFKSHNLNIQNHEFSLYLNDIVSVDRYKNLGFIRNGLTITSKHNKIDKFVVDQASEWIKKFN